MGKKDEKRACTRVYSIQGLTQEATDSSESSREKTWSLFALSEQGTLKSLEASQRAFSLVVINVLVAPEVLGSTPHGSKCSRI